VQRLIAKPEHNGKGACVLSFDASTGRYAAALDEVTLYGKELSLKAECAVRAGCAAAGCAPEEARAASAHGARQCGTARASAIAQTERRTGRRAPQSARAEGR